MYQWYPSKKETSNKNNTMYSTPVIKRIVNVVCPSAPIKSKLTEVIIDDGKLHEIVVHCNRRLVF